MVATTDDGETIDYGPQPTGNDAMKLWATVESVRRGTPPACPPEAAAAHTALVSAAQASCTPSAFPADAVATTGGPGRPAVFVRGLDAVLDACSANWACPGRGPDARCGCTARPPCEPAAGAELLVS